MPYQFITNGSTAYAIDWDLVDRLLLSHCKAMMLDAYSRVVRLSESKWYDPTSWGLPEIEQLEVDWLLVRSKARAKYESDRAFLRKVAPSSVLHVAQGMQWAVAKTAALKEKQLGRMKQLHSDNMLRIAKSADSFGTKADVAKILRDSVADGLTVGAMFVPAGQAVALMAGGSFVKGVARYQDSDSKYAAGVGSLEAVGSFMWAAVQLDPMLGAKGKWVLAVVQAGYEVGLSLLEGKSLAETAGAAGVKLTGPLVDHFFESEAVKKLFAKATLPVKARFKAPKETSELAVKWAAEVAKKQGIENPTAAALKPAEGNGSEDDAPKPGRLARHTILSEERLLELAIINMELGAGNGW